MNHIRQVFGEDADLYTILGLKSRDEAENPAKLRKAYFRQALVYHPDKTKHDPAQAKEKFQAISFAYQVLKNPDKRAEYNETGHVDDEGYDSDNDGENAGTKNWKDYFDRIFGKVTTSKIDQFAVKYKCSEEEQKDVLKEYKAHKGNLVKMLEFVMLSSELDAKRWVEDYIQPSIEEGTVPDYSDTVQKTLKKLTKKIEKQQEQEHLKKKPSSKKQKKTNDNKKENKKPASDEDDDDDDNEEDAMSDDQSDEDATESEDEEVIASPPPSSKKRKAAAAANNTKKVTATKAKPTKAKPAKKTKENDLVAMIQANQSKRSGGLFASIGARYGVKMDDDDDDGNDNDPLNDEEFERIQNRLKKNKKRAR